MFQKAMHHTVNTGSVPLVTYFVFRSDAGQDYGSIEGRVIAN